MRLLFDTHAFLWWVLADPRLSKTAKSALDQEENSLHLSAAVAWEIATKHRIGKLPEGDALLRRWVQVMRDLQITPLSITLDHAIAAGTWDAAHRDPFDRIIAAQARIEDMAIVTSDRAFRAFPVRTMW